LKRLAGGLVNPSQQTDRNSAVSAASHQLSESLSAITAYVATARQLLMRQAAPQHGALGEILDKAAAQADRAGEAFRQLRALIRPGEDGCGGNN
jgi:two-component system sensor kinase FixL